MKTSAEAVIIGGGVMGCSVLHHLAALGMRDTALLEQNVLGSGSTGRSLAILRMHYSNPITSIMAWRSLRAFRDFPDEVGHPSGYVNTGYFLIVDPSDRGAMEENLAMQRGLGIDARAVSKDEVGELAPMLRVDESEAVAYEPQSGMADPYLVTVGYAQRACDAGARLTTGAEVVSIGVGGGRVRSVTTAGGDVIHTPRVLVAAGPWSRRLVSPLGVDLPLEAVRHQAVMVRRPDRLVPTHPIVGDITQGIMIRPHSGDFTVVAAGEDPADVGGYNEGVDPDTVADVIPKLARRMPDMAGGYFRGGWSGLFTVTPDWHPIMDRVEGVEGLYCAVGFSGHGFKLSPMIGLCMAEMMAHGESASLDVSPFRMSRFQEEDLLTSKYSYNVLA